MDPVAIMLWACAAVVVAIAVVAIVAAIYTLRGIVAGSGTAEEPPSTVRQIDLS